MEKFKRLLFYMVFFMFVLAFSSIARNYDVDLWARLIAGMGFVQSGRVLMHDFLSYTPTHIWYDHEWGSGVVFYLTQHLFPSVGFIFLQAILIFLTFFFVTKIIKLRGCKTTTEYNFLFYYFAFISISYIVDSPVRCQMFSFLFFTIFLYILELARNDKIKPLMLLPILMIIWNNMHGGCVSGIGLALIYLVGEFLNRKPINKYFITLISLIFVLPINPWGFAYLNFLHKAVSMQRPLIIEWLGLFHKFNMFAFMKFKIFALILILAELGIVIKQLISKTFYFDKTKYLVLFATMYIAIQHVKFIPFAVISMACFLYKDFYTVFNFITKGIFNKIGNIKDALVYFIIIIFAIYTIKMNGFGPYLNWERYPVRAVEFIKINKIKGKLLADFPFGSYISYKLYPNNTIFMDGRYEEVYDDDMLFMLGHFHVGKNGMDALLKKFPPDIILVAKNYPVFSILKSEKKWELVFDDNQFALFLKPQDLKKYNQPLKMPSLDIKYYKKTLFDTDIKFIH